MCCHLQRELKGRGEATSHGEEEATLKTHTESWGPRLLGLINCFQNFLLNLFFHNFNLKGVRVSIMRGYRDKQNLNRVIQ